MSIKQLEEVKKSYFKCTKKQNWENLLILLGSMEADHEQIEDLLNRIDKAVEYIKDKDNYNELTDFEFADKKEVVDKLINILRGDE